MFVTIWYLYLSNQLTKSTKQIDLEGTVLVIKNVVIADLLFLAMLTLYNFGEFNLLNIIWLLLAQEVWFYTTHRIAHKYFYEHHKIHHGILHPLYAWKACHAEHLIVNLGSFGVPFLMFPNNIYVFCGLVALQIYTSINGHTGNTEHALHHYDMTKRFGSIYILDRLFGSY